MTQRTSAKWPQTWVDIFLFKQNINPEPKPYKSKLHYTQLNQTYLSRFLRLFCPKTKKKMNWTCVVYSVIKYLFPWRRVHVIKIYGRPCKTFPLQNGTHFSYHLHPPYRTVFHPSSSSIAPWDVRLPFRHSIWVKGYHVGWKMHAIDHPFQHVERWMMVCFTVVSLPWFMHA